MMLAKSCRQFHPGVNARRIDLFLSRYEYPRSLEALLGRLELPSEAYGEVCVGGV